MTISVGLARRAGFHRRSGAVHVGRDRAILRAAGWRASTPIGGSENIDPAGSLRADGHGDRSDRPTAAPAPFTELPADRFEDYLGSMASSSIIDERVAARRERRSPGANASIATPRRCSPARRRRLPSRNPWPSPTRSFPTRIRPCSFGAFHGASLLRWRAARRRAGRGAAAERSVGAVVGAQRRAGAFSLALPRAGVWLVKSVHMVRAGFFSDCRLGEPWASLTFEMPRRPRPMIRGHRRASAARLLLVDALAAAALRAPMRMRSARPRSTLTAAARPHLVGLDHHRADRRSSTGSRARGRAQRSSRTSMPEAVRGPSSRSSARRSPAISTSASTASPRRPACRSRQHRNAGGCDLPAFVVLRAEGPMPVHARSRHMALRPGLQHLCRGLRRRGAAAAR